MFAAGKLRGLATTATKLLPQLPGVPTFAEKGIVESGLNLVMGLYAPKGLPDAVRATLVAAVAKAAKDAAFTGKIASIGLFAEYEDPAAARKRLDSEYTDIVALSRKLQN